MAGMLQILTYMFGFYFVIKGLEIFMVAAASGRPNRSGLFVFATIAMLICLAGAVGFAVLQDNQATSLQSSMP
jgi:uncharacterized membrane protein